MGKDCPTVEPLLAGYALGALEGDDLLRVEAHVDGCESCSETLAAYEQIAHGLLHTPAPVQPPARVRAGLIGRLAASNPARLGQRLVRASWPRLALAVAVAALVVLNLASLGMIRALVGAQQAMAVQVQNQQTVMALVTYPDTKIAQVYGQGGTGTFVYDPSLDFAVLNAWALKPLASDQTYQAWLVLPDGKRVSGGTFVVTATSAFTTLVVHSPTPISHYVAVGVTIEPAGGSPAPTGPRVLAADL
jgi:anti-sigma-K factor RskA